MRLADRFDQGVSSLDARLEGARTELEAGGQVGPSCTSAVKGTAPAVKSTVLAVKTTALAIKTTALGRTRARVTLSGDRSHCSSEGPWARGHTTARVKDR